MVFVEEFGGRILEQRPSGVVGGYACELEDVAAAIDEVRVFGSGPNQIASIDPFIEHGAGEVMGLDELDCLDGAAVLDLGFEVGGAGKYPDGDEQRSGDEDGVGQGAVMLGVVVDPGNGQKPREDGCGKDAEGEEQTLMAGGHPRGQGQDDDFVPVQGNLANQRSEGDADENGKHGECAAIAEVKWLPLGNSAGVDGELKHDADGIED